MEKDLASPAERLALLPPDKRAAVFAQMDDWANAEFPYDWENWWARPNQLPPGGDWTFWLLLAGRGFGKGVALDTPLATPGGWTTMGELKAGDALFDETGRPCRVLEKFSSPVTQNYRITFSDGSEIVADAPHQWVTWTHAERKAFLRSVYIEDPRFFPEDWPKWRCPRITTHLYLDRSDVEQALILSSQGFSARKIERRLGISRSALAKHLRAVAFVDRPVMIEDHHLGPRVRNTEQIRSTLYHGIRDDLNHCVPLALPLQLPDADLPLDPWLLGYWIGNGTTGEGALTSGSWKGEFDREHVCSMVAAAGYEFSYRDNAEGGVSYIKIREFPIPLNKIISWQYLRASESQRLALLRGLMDSDGHAPPNGHVEFCTIVKELAEQVKELVVSLGERCVLAEDRARLDGRDCGPRFRITWQPSLHNPFSLPRKARNVKQPGSQGLRLRHRMIVAVEPIDPEPMACITVDSPNEMYLAGRAMVPTHNTRTGAQTIIRWARESRQMIALVAPTQGDIRDVMIEGPGGILRSSPPWNMPAYEPSKRHKVTWPNGSVAYGYSAEEPERLRGHAHTRAWCDELGAWSYPEETWDQLMFGMREGTDVRCVVTTTPRPIRLLTGSGRDGQRLGLLHDPRCVVTKGTSYENRSNLAPDFFAQIIQRYEDTRQGRQELLAEILDDVPGALWTRGMLDATRTMSHDDLVRVVVGIDPAVTSGDESDETGIVVCGRDRRGHGYVLADASGRYAPNEWAQVAVAAYEAHNADVVVAEVNNGGEMVEATLRQSPKGRNLPYRAVRASRGKAKRAQPISMLWETGRAHIVGSFPRMEDEMVLIVPDFDADKAGFSPSRTDALVWAMTDLFVDGQPGLLWDEDMLRMRA